MRKHHVVLVITAVVAFGLLLIAFLLLGNMRSNGPTEQAYGQPSQRAQDNRGFLGNFGGGNENELTITENDVSYAVYEDVDGEIESLQNANLFLSSKGYNETGGSLLFNHPGGVATDGERLFLADRNNNRVLVWNSLPESDNVEPDFVLGQENFSTNNPGTELNQMNWPIAVSAAGGKLIVADSYNDRVLVWNEIPSGSGEAADFAIETSDVGRGDRGSLVWPWDIWTNGEKLIITSPMTQQVLIWNTFPTGNGVAPDIALQNEAFGTPRSIGTDGTALAISDHNAYQNTPGTFFWTSFPESDTSEPDFFVEAPSQMAGGGVAENAEVGGQGNESHGLGELTWMTMHDGALYALAGRALYRWNTFPQMKNQAPDQMWDARSGFEFNAGDGSGVAIGDGKMYASLSNGNMIAGFDTVPVGEDDGVPAFVIGAPDLSTNTLETNYIMSNPVPASDGEGLIVSSDFDRAIYVWKNVPDELADPDYVYSMPEAPWDSAWSNDVYVAAGKQHVFVWDEELPTSGAEPSHTFERSIGSVQFQEIKGVAYNGTYLFVSDMQANTIYVWEGIPGEQDEPIARVTMNQPQRINASSTHLIVSTVYGQEPITIFTIEEALTGAAGTSVRGEQYNLPEGVAITEDGKVAVADTSFNRVHVWNTVDAALSGAASDVTLGTEEEREPPQIGEASLFWPAGITMVGNTLWVGEFKFSERLLRFNP